MSTNQTSLEPSEDMVGRLDQMMQRMAVADLQESQMWSARNPSPEARAVNPSTWERLWGSPDFQRAIDMGPLGPVGGFVTRSLVSTAGKVNAAFLSENNYDFSQLRNLNATEVRDARIDLVINAGATVVMGLGAASPRQTMDLSGDFVRIDARTYRYMNPEDGHGLFMYVDNGILGFDIKALGDRGLFGSGKDMFRSGMRRLTIDGHEISGIRGYWMDGEPSVNLSEYTKNLASQMNPRAAASETWTGRMARDYGYSVVSEPKPGFGAKVDVLFSRPAGQ